MNIGMANVVEENSPEDETQKSMEPEEKQKEDSEKERGDTTGVEPDISLRDYQAELAEPALSGKNTIVCAPTGSGKTRIAAFVTYEHLKCHPGGKVLLLVNKVPLVEQHYKKEFSQLQCKYRVNRVCGETAAKLSFKQLIEDNDVVILTAQILENALKGAEENDDKVNLTDFSLLIFDECHHTQKGEVYNNIMSQYLTLKIEQGVTGLPQILGLTASLGVGGAKDKYKAIQHILQLCANMDTSVLKTVTRQEEELEQHNNEPKKCVAVVADRDTDPFGDDLKKIMKEIQQKLPDEYKNRSDFGTQMYEQYITSLNSIAVQKENRSMMTVSEHLRKYNDALLINDSVRMVDAIKYLEEFYDSEEERRQGFDATDEALMDLFEGRLVKLMKLSKKKEFENPKLLKLKNQILEEYTDKINARCIIFTRTRQSTKALVSWIQDTPKLKKILKVERLTGTGTTSSSKSAAMTQKEQQDIIRKFRDGELNCLIATTVAEEGLDIPECNIVIRYNLVTNEIAMVQARGRARAEDSSYTLVAGKSSGAAERELSNMYKEKLEKSAVDSVQKFKKEEFMKDIKKLQVTALNNRKIQAASVRAKKRVSLVATANLHCRKCNTMACSASEIRKIEDMHHVNPNEEFQEKFTVKEFPAMEYGQITCVGKILCKKCEKDWGSMILHKGALLPCLSIKYFGLKFQTGFILTPKKWKDVPFDIQALDFMEFIEKKLNVPLADIKQTE
ncbi:interferon-induced helicase C domain-containing protein 1-like [Glandiceps talaboti]